MPPLKLEIFPSGGGGPDSMDTVAASDLEEARLAAYEQGYAAGWDDCVAAQAEDQRRLRSDLARHLQAMSFTFHEARSHVLRALGPLLQEVVTHLLPPLAREAIAPVVLETLMPLAENLADKPLVMVLHPDFRAAVELLLEMTSGLSVTLRDEPSLGEGQVYLLLGEDEGEVRIDLDRAMAEIIGAVTAFFAITDQERRHG